LCAANEDQTQAVSTAYNAYSFSSSHSIRSLEISRVIWEIKRNKADESDLPTVLSFCLSEKKGSVKIVFI